jgi:GDP/UDP-N,N'-diacetylbacillosamine 2-epimerase (hydrolysing)|tara:strand:- start:704 stop:1870 length:1167 start_codon:yes stop_codon:yes gene_type:complete
MKKVAIITGTRAEYGLLRPLIKAISEDCELKLLLIASGMHLSEVFGYTYEEIEADGFIIDRKVEDHLSGDSALAITKALGIGMIGFSEAFDELDPDLVIVLGDRSEILAAVIAAMIKGIPTAHLHGGESTEGAYDESIRHAITKMSFLHFTSTELYRKRVIQLGESPDRVFNVGAIGVDSIKKIKLLSRVEFEKSICFKLKKYNIIITFHPVTLEKSTAKKQFSELLKAVDKLENTSLIFTKPNSDKDGYIIIKMIDEYVALNPEKAISFISMGQLRYLSALKYIDVVVGNSSSGIYEAPIFHKPTINIGDRQKGRFMPISVINCKPFLKDIDKAFKLAFNKEFNNSIKSQKSMFGNGTATQQIIETIKSYKIEGVKKSFYDLHANKN